MRDLMLELTGLGIDYRRVVDGPFVELPGIPGPAIMLQSPGGPVRVHACRDVKDGTISAFMDERGAAWETGPLR